MKKITKIALLITLLVIMVGCSFNSPFYYPPHKEKLIIIEPKVGDISKVSLGNSLITSGTGYFADVLIVKNTASKSHTMGMWTLTVSKGIYELAHKDDTFRYFNPMVSEQLYNRSSVAKDLGEKCLKVSNTKSIYYMNNTYMTLNLDDIYNDLNIEFKNNFFITEENSFQQTLIYTGKMGNVLKFSYREFSDDLARPAFSTDISYDLTESKIIGYKDFKAEIIEATNTELTYKILQGF